LLCWPSLRRRGLAPPSRRRGRRLSSRCAPHPQGVWLHRPGALADWEIDAIRHADARTPIVLYNVPRRDCGSYSQGGARLRRSTSPGCGWSRASSAGAPVPVIVEPDALALMTCLGAAGRAARIEAIRRGVAILRRDTKAKIYVDAGKEGWHTPEEMAALLAGGPRPGIALNVSDFDWTSSEVGYGRRISRLTGGLHFVVDTSRNGAGPAPGAVGQDLGVTRRAVRSAGRRRPGRASGSSTPTSGSRTRRVRRRVRAGRAGGGPLGSGLRPVARRVRQRGPGRAPRDGGSGPRRPHNPGDAASHRPGRRPRPPRPRTPGRARPARALGAADAATETTFVTTADGWALAVSRYAPPRPPGAGRSSSATASAPTASPSTPTRGSRWPYGWPSGAGTSTASSCAATG